MFESCRAHQHIKPFWPKCQEGFFVALPSTAMGHPISASFRSGGHPPGLPVAVEIDRAGRPCIVEFGKPCRDQAQAGIGVQRCRLASRKDAKPLWNNYGPSSPTVPSGPANTPPP